jgi:hypothetical protein
MLLSDYGCNGRYDSPDALHCIHISQLHQLLRFLFQQAIERFLHTTTHQFLYSLLMISSFSCTIFSDKVFCLLSNGCVVTPILPETENLVLLFCETYCTLSHIEKSKEKALGIFLTTIQKYANKKSKLQSM